MNNSEDRVELLIELLEDRSARLDERDDAAMDLADFDDPRALAALLRAGSDPLEHETIVSSCGASIGEIVVRTGVFDPSWMARLAPVALSEVRARVVEVHGRGVRRGSDLTPSV